MIVLLVLFQIDGGDEMNRISFRAIVFVSIVALMFGLSISAGAQSRIMTRWSYVGIQPVPGQPSAEFFAKLVDPMQKAKQRSASVEVRVEGIQLIEPASAGGQVGQAHIHYILD